MTIDLHQDTENLINNKLISGPYPSADALLKEALKLLEEKEDYKKYVNKAISEAEESIRNGNILDDKQLGAFIESLMNK